MTQKRRHGQTPFTVFSVLYHVASGKASIDPPSEKPVHLQRMIAAKPMPDADAVVHRPAESGGGLKEHAMRIPSQIEKHA
jgi:hypothetical protein